MSTNRANQSHMVEEPLVVTTRSSSHDKNKHFDYNLYATKKSAAQGLLDLALLMANAAQLKHIIMTGADHRFYIIMMVLICSSIGLQIMVGIALLILAKFRITNEMLNEEETDAEYNKSKLNRVDFLNNIVVICIFILTVINVFISAFGLNEAPKENIRYREPSNINQHSSNINPQ